MPISRRRFLKGATVAAVSSAVVSRDALAGPVSSAERILVLVELSGGNDGLNTVIPIADRHYALARPTLAIPRAQALMLDRSTALHPAMVELHAMFGRNELAIVQGVGYANPSRSHFRSMEIWHRGDMAPEASTGWLGRYCRQAWGALADRVAPALHFGSECPELFRGASPASELPDALVLDGENVPEAARAMLARLRTPKAAYPANALGASLATAAQLIVQKSGVRLFHLSQGGFDTHAHQAKSHAQALGALSAAVGAFMADLKAEGRQRDVVVMIFSEFGRRVRENSSAGTDHGAAGVLLVAGGSVKGGLYGRSPSLTDLSDGDLKASVDFRACYATVLERWLDVPADRVLPGRVAPLAFL